MFGLLAVRVVFLPAEERNWRLGGIPGLSLQRTKGVNIRTFLCLSNWWCNYWWHACASWVWRLNYPHLTSSACKCSKYVFSVSQGPCVFSLSFADCVCSHVSQIRSRGTPNQGCFRKHSCHSLLTNWHISSGDLGSVLLMKPVYSD